MKCSPNPSKTLIYFQEDVEGSPPVLLNGGRGTHRADVLRHCARSRLLRSSTQKASMAISLQSFKVKNRVRRCGFPRKTQFEGSLPWITGALPGRLCESASPVRSSQNIFKLALPAPNTRGPVPRFAAHIPIAICREIMRTLGCITVSMDIRHQGLRNASPECAGLPWASTARRRVHDNLRGMILCTAMIFYGELFTPDSLTQLAKVLVSNGEDTVSLGILGSHSSGCHDSPERGSA